MSALWIYNHQDDHKTINDVLYNYEEMISIYEIRIQLARKMMIQFDSDSNDYHFFDDIIKETENKIEHFKRKQMVMKNQL